MGTSRKDDKGAVENMFEFFLGKSNLHAFSFITMSILRKKCELHSSQGGNHIAHVTDFFS